MCHFQANLNNKEPLTESSIWKALSLHTSRWLFGDSVYCRIDSILSIRSVLGGWSAAGGSSTENMRNGEIW